MDEFASISIKADTRELSTASRKLDELGRTGDRAEKSLSGSSRRMSASIGTVAKAAAGAAAAYLSFNAAVGAVTSVVNATRDLERFNNALIVGSGSVQGAADSMKFLREQAETLGLDLRTSTEQFSKLAAAAQGTVLEGQATRDIFTAIAKASTVLGLSADQTGGALTAIQQIISKGTVSAEELRGQLGERLPGAFQIAARAAGVTTEELGKMLQRGEVLAEDLLPALAVELENTFGDQSTEAAKGLNAQINRMDTALFDLQIAVGETGLIDLFTDGLAAATNFFNFIAKGIGSGGQLSEIDKQVQRIADLRSELASLNDKKNIPFGEIFLFDKRQADLLEQQIEDATEDLEKMRAEFANTAKEAESTSKEIEKVAVATEKESKVTKSAVSNRRELAEAAREQAELERRRSDLLGEVEQVIRSVETEEEKLTRTIFELNRLLFSGELGWETYERAVRQAKDEIKDSADEIDDAGEQLDQFAIQASRNMQSAFADGFFDLFEGRTDGIVDSFADAVKRMVANALAADLLGSLFGTSSGFENLSGIANAFGGIGGAGSTSATGSGISGLLGNGLSGLGALAPALGAGALSIGIGSALAGDKKLFGLNGTVTSTIGTVVGSALGPVGGILGSLSGALFGRGPLKLQDSLIRGSVNSEGIGDNFLTATNFKAKGGLLRGDKVDRVIINANTGELINGAPGLPESGISSKLDPFAAQASQQAQEIGQLFDTTIQGFNQSIRESAGVLGIGTQALDRFNQFIQITSDGAEEITETQLVDLLTRLGDTMANTLAPGLVTLTKSGETSVQALARMAQEFTVLQDALIIFGASADQADAALSRLAFSTRTALVDAAGGAEALGAQLSFFAGNFLTLGEQVEVQFQQLRGELNAVGISANISREAYKELIISVTEAGGASTELASTLLRLAPQFIALKDAQDRLAQSSQQAIPAVENLAATIDTSFQRISDARAAVVNAENQLQVAEAQSALSQAQAAFSQAGSDLANARSELQQAQSREEQQISTSINDVIQGRNELINLYNDEANALRNTVSRFDSFVSRIDAFRTSLDTGGLSPLTPGEQLATTRQRFNETRRLAQQGDEAALDRLPAAAEDFLKASQTFNASNATFTSDFNFVQQVLRDAGVAAENQRDIAEEQLTGIQSSIEELTALNESSRDQLDQLRGINDSGLSVAEATRNLESAQDRFNSLQGDVLNATDNVTNAVRESGGFINDVERATNAVEIAVRELMAAVFQGQGNPNATTQQIQDFVRANPGMTDQQFARAAADAGINNQQLSSALRPLGVSQQRINQATGGTTVSDQFISEVVDSRLANGKFREIYDLAVANGISSQRLASASVLTPEEIDQFVRANNLPPFERGTDFVNKGGLAVLHRAEAVTPASAPRELKAEVIKMKGEITQLRREQADQMSVLVNSIIKSSKDNAKAIADTNRKLSAAVPWLGRVASGAN